MQDDELEVRRTR
jgi:hypothetical protein